MRALGIHRNSFNQIVSENVSVAKKTLMKKGRMANGMAKMRGIKKKAKKALYRAKYAVLNHGLEKDLFQVRSDRDQREELVVIGPSLGNSLHQPKKYLTHASLVRPQVRVALGKGCVGTRIVWERT